MRLTLSTTTTFTFLTLKKAREFHINLIKKGLSPLFVLPSFPSHQKTGIPIPRHTRPFYFPYRTVVLLILPGRPFKSSMWTLIVSPFLSARVFTENVPFGRTVPRPNN